MKKLVLICGTIVLIFICSSLFLASSHIDSKEIISIRIKDTFSGDTPDGFPSPGERIALSITVAMDFIPEESYIVCDTGLVKIENNNTKFYAKRADTLINTPLEPVIFIKENCPTDILIPFILVYSKDTILDTISFNIHTVGIVDSCYLDKKVNKTSNKLHVKVASKATEGYPSGYTGILAEIRDSVGEIIDTVKLFDDGKHFDKDEGDGQFANSWWTPSSPKDYVIDLILMDSTMNHSFTMRQTIGFTTKDFSLTQPYLIVGDPYSDSPENEVVESIKELMDSLNLGYDNWNIWFRGYPDSNEILHWGRKKVILIWATRLGGTLKHSTKGKEIIQHFLKRSGNLFLSTTYLGKYIEDYGSELDLLFYEDILCSRFVSRFTSDDSVKTLTLSNPCTDQVSDTFNLILSLHDTNRFISFAEIIKPVSPALPIVTLLEREDSTVIIDTSSCFGLKVEKDKYKIIYLCFNMNEISPFSVRKNFFGESLKWLSEETTDTFSYQHVLEKDIELVRLSDPYPNPFLNESTIPFTLLSAGEVNLMICDLLGRTVRYLIRSSLSEGNYYAVWDGKDEKGDGTAVGYYFIRLEIKTVDKSSGKEKDIVVSKKLLKLRK